MADTIRVLVATDNHVGYAEQDPIRGDDSWKTFHEIMCLARQRDADMVLLCGDLFHENRPSRKSLYNVMRSLRLNCYGDKPCELELLSDGSEHFDSTIGHANYEDPDINVAIPVFSIHGNHDDPSGQGLYAALDILEMAGLLNYFGRVPQSDNITVRPLFFQKGNTKLALYGLSNVRDERLHRTFRDNKVVFKRPGTQQQDWYNLMCVHQNHHAHTETSYLPENQLPNYMDLVIWGHEHECDQIAHKNPETGFKVLQPGSSVATSLVPGEAVPKHVFMLSVTGRDCKIEPIRLKTVRPFVYKNVVLADFAEAKKIARRAEHRSELTRFLENIVDGLIEQAKKDWEEAQSEQDDEDSDDESAQFPLPIIRLRVDTTSPDNIIKFDIENPQRFSNRFMNRVANRNDVLQVIARKKSHTNKAASSKQIDEDALAGYQPETIQMKRLVKDFLDAQSLAILPTNHFGNVVNDYVKGDHKVMDSFVTDALANQIQHLVSLHDNNEDADEDAGETNLLAAAEKHRLQMEEMFSNGQIKRSVGPGRYQPKPDDWDSDVYGEWEEQPQAHIQADGVSDDDNVSSGDNGGGSTSRAAARSRGRGGRGGRTTASTSARGTGGRGRGAASKAAPSTTRARKKSVADPTDDEDEDIVMVDDDDTDDDFSAADDSQALFIPEKKGRTANGTSRTKPAAIKTATGSKRTIAASKTQSSVTVSQVKQSTLNFSQSQSNGGGARGRQNGGLRGVVEDSDNDDDAFEEAPSRRGRR